MKSIPTFDLKNSTMRIIFTLFFILSLIGLQAQSSISGKPHSKETIGKAIDRLIEKKQILVNAKAMYSPIPV